jgi:hypothetical protein
LSAAVFQKEARKTFVDWRDVYQGHVEDMFRSGPDIYVFFSKGYYKERTENYRVFADRNLFDNMRPHQNDPSIFPEKMFTVSIPAKPVGWRVVHQIDERSNIGNLFRPTAYMQIDADSVKGVSIPSSWDRLLKRLAGPAEREWLLNYMAYYLQTLNNCVCMPVLAGAQGTGKTLIASLFGDMFGSFAAVSSKDINSDFNSWRRNAVVLVDEATTSHRESIMIKNLIKQLSNEEVLVNEKNRERYSCRVNNSVWIAYNPQFGQNSIDVEETDRRFTFITGGTNERTSREEAEELISSTYEMAEYLWSREVDEVAANTPLHNEEKASVQEESKPWKFKQALAAMEDLAERLSLDEYPAFLFPHFTDPAQGPTLSQLVKELNQRDLNSRYLSEVLKDPTAEKLFEMKKSGGYWRVKHKLDFGHQLADDSESPF